MVYRSTCGRFRVGRSVYALLDHYYHVCYTILVSKTTKTRNGEIKMTTKTIGKYLTNEGTVSTYFDQTHDEGYGQGVNNSNVFFEGTTLYSYGKHFPMAVLHEGFYFINADSYSPTTGKHQSYVQRFVPKNLKVEIPFSALKEAGIDIKDIIVVDKESSRYFDKVDKDGNPYQSHLMGSTLFTVTKEVPNIMESRYRDTEEQYGMKKETKYFLSGIDETAKNLNNGFFLTELVGSVETVEEAYESMKPLEVKWAEERGEDVKRQGEYFFIPVQNTVTIEMLKHIEKVKDFRLEKKKALSHQKRDVTLAGGFDFAQSRHVVTNYIDILGQVYAKGTCRHIAGEHKMLKLDEWHLVAENIQEKSWTAEGRVD